MSELLKEFVELAPKGWRVSDANDFEWVSWFVPDGQFDRSYPEPQPYGHLCEAVLWDDMRSAYAIIFLWDYLNRDHHTNLADRFAGPDQPITWDLQWAKRDPRGRVIRTCGSTRIEALVQACVALWKSKEQTP